MPDVAARAVQTREIIRDHLCLDADLVVDSAVLTTDLSADSLDCVEITMNVEEAYGIRIGDDEANACSTVGDWVAIAERKVTEKAAA